MSDNGQQQQDQQERNAVEAPSSREHQGELLRPQSPLTIQRREAEDNEGPLQTESNDQSPSEKLFERRDRKFTAVNRARTQAADVLRSSDNDPFAEKSSEKGDENQQEKQNDQVSDISVLIEEEDASDLFYDKELKILLEDHKRVSKFTMLIAIGAMIGQIVFAVWRMRKLNDMGSWDDALLINWYHLLKIFMNLYVIQSFIKRIKARQPSTPLAYLSSYITLILYLAFLFVHADLIPDNIAIEELNFLAIYAGSDWLLLFFSWTIQKNIIARRDQLFKFQAGGITQEKKDDDLFDVRYLPEEYMSDIQDDSDEEDEAETVSAASAAQSQAQSQQ